MFYTAKLKPAYNRRYASKPDLLKDWENGKDFYSVTHGAYCSNRDLPNMRRDGCQGIEFFLGNSLTQSFYVSLLEIA